MTSSLTICKTGASTVNSGNTRYSTIAGHLTFGSQEELTTTPCPPAGSFKYLYVYVSANSTSGGSTLKMYTASTWNGTTAASSLSVTIDGTTGVFLDTTNSCSVAGNFANYRLVVTGGGSLTLRVVSAQFTPTTVSECHTWLMARGVVSTSADSQTSYMLPSGYLDALNTTESLRTFRIRTPGLIYQFSANVSANARTTNTVIRTRKNAANGACSVTFGNLETGWKNSISSENVVVDDDFNYQIVTGTGAGGTEAISIAFVFCQFLSTRHEFIMLASSGGGTTLTAGTLRYCAPAGRMFLEGTESQAELGSGVATYCDFHFAVKDLAIFTGTNSLDVTTDVVYLRNNNVSFPKIRITTGDDDTLLMLAGIISWYVGGNVPFSYELDAQSATTGTLGVIWMSCVGCVHKAPPPRKRRPLQAALVR